MRQSNLLGVTRREVPAGETSKNAILLSRGGYVDKTMAGVYSFLPLGLRVIKKVSDIVRHEMDALPGAQEILLPVLQPLSLWAESGRLDDMSEIMYQWSEDGIGLGPTHEEVLTDIFRRHVGSYRELPLSVYQIQTKFRKEARAKSGLLRGREFIMKDMYTFHDSIEDLDHYYDLVTKAYFNIFKRVGVKAILTEASGGVFSKRSHEFQAITDGGEDTIYLNKAGDFARNKEIVDENDPEFLQFCEGQIVTKTAVEVGNIFKLNRKFSSPMKAAVTTKQGTQEDVWMGCYGLGISRLLGILPEIYGDVSAGKINWPRAVAPFQIHLLELSETQASDLYRALLETGVEILYDDRDESAGTKFADADLIGSPYRIIAGQKTRKDGTVDLINFSDNKTIVVPISDVAKIVDITSK